jgi:hypothetical protein
MVVASAGVVAWPFIERVYGPILRVRPPMPVKPTVKSLWLNQLPSCGEGPTVNSRLADPLDVTHLRLAAALLTDGVLRARAART